MLGKHLFTSGLLNRPGDISVRGEYIPKICF